MAMPRVEIFKAETEAGTHFPGQSRAPAAVVEAGGLRKRLSGLGYRVHVDDCLAEDTNAKAAATWQSSTRLNGVRNEENTLRVMRAVRTHLECNLRQSPGCFPLVVGGDCSITPAVLSAFWAAQAPGTSVGLLYIDGDADLTLPSQADFPGSSAILDSMTLTHLTGRAGGLESMRAFARPDGIPLVGPENAVLFGFDPLQPSTEHWVYLLEQGFKAYTRPPVQQDAVGCVRQALQWLRKRVDIIYVHFDVDVIDCGRGMEGRFGIAS